MRKNEGCRDCGKKRATLHGKFCAAHLKERLAQYRQPSRASRAAGKANSALGPRLCGTPTIEVPDGSWWARPMSWEEFQSERQRQQERMESNPKYGKKRGGPVIEQW